MYLIIEYNHLLLLNGCRVYDCSVAVLFTSGDLCCHVSTAHCLLLASQCMKVMQLLTQFGCFNEYIVFVYLTVSTIVYIYIIQHNNY